MAQLKQAIQLRCIRYIRRVNTRVESVHEHVILHRITRERHKRRLRQIKHVNKLSKPSRRTYGLSRLERCGSWIQMRRWMRPTRRHYWGPLRRWQRLRRCRPACSTLRRWQRLRRRRHACSTLSQWSRGSTLRLTGKRRACDRSSRHLKR